LILNIIVKSSINILGISSHTMNLAFASLCLLYHFNVTLSHLDKGPAIYILSAHVGRVLDVVINFSLVIKDVLDLLLSEL
jgi:hypothetical protein